MVESRETEVEAGSTEAVSTHNQLLLFIFLSPVFHLDLDLAAQKNE